MNTTRVEELIKGLKAFGKETYQKSELLPEMMELQQEMVNLTFNDVHASTADLRIYDIERYFEQLNNDCWGAANEELKKFKEGCKTFSNLIKAEVSGNRGEYKAFRTLEELKTDNRVIKNVELHEYSLNHEGCKVEIDALVITAAGVTIVEVKNTGRDVYINESGNYYRTGEYLKWDSNIGTKMHNRETAVKHLLKNLGLEDVQIQSVVAFTNDRIEVHNKYDKIKTCFANQLNDVIESFNNSRNMTQDEMDKLSEYIEKKKSVGSYHFEFDVEQFKADFAVLMSKLEEASSECTAEEIKFEHQEENEEQTVQTREKANNIDYRIVNGIGKFAAVITISAVLGYALGRYVNR